MDLNLCYAIPSFFQCSVSVTFVTDPDSRIRTTELRIRIHKNQISSLIFLLIIHCRYFTLVFKVFKIFVITDYRIRTSNDPESEHLF
jgi:hypothetical protein